MARSNLEKQLTDLDRLRSRGVITDDEYQARRAALIATPANAAAPPRRGSFIGGAFKLGFLGCLGIIAAVVGILVVIGILLAAAGSGDSDDGNGGPGDVGTNPGDVHVPLAVGSSGEIAPERNGSKRSRVTIVQIADNVTTGSTFIRPAAGQKWWGVEVVVENVGTSEVNAISWKLRDSNDGEHDEAFVVGAGQPLDRIYNLTPGGKAQGWVFFEIPTGTSPKWLRADPNLFLANDLYFDAR